MVPSAGSQNNTLEDLESGAQALAKKNTESNRARNGACGTMSLAKRASQDLVAFASQAVQQK